MAPIEYLDVRAGMEAEPPVPADELVTKAGVLPFTIEKTLGGYQLCIGVVSPLYRTDNKRFMPFTLPKGTMQMGADMEDTLHVSKNKFGTTTTTRIHEHDWYDISTNYEKKAAQHADNIAAIDTRIYRALTEARQEFGLEKRNIHSVFNCGAQRYLSGKPVHMFAAEVKYPDGLAHTPEARWINWVSLPDLRKAVKEGIGSPLHIDITEKIVPKLQAYYEKEYDLKFVTPAPSTWVESVQRKIENNGLFKN